MSTTATLRRAWRAVGPVGLARAGLAAARDRVHGRAARSAAEVAGLVRGAAALEIGGPSAAFTRRGLLPVYGELSSADNVNFAGATLWERDLRDGGAYTPEGRRLGTQYLREAGDLHGLPDERYDVVLSSHTLEHLANPLRALREWRRVCRPDGLLVLVLPHRDGTFDHRRPVTPLSHLRADEERSMDESDDTHVPEVLRLHDLRRDWDVSSAEDFRIRVEDNLSTRTLHHHVFVAENALEAVADAGWSPIMAEARRPFDLLIVARNGPRAEPLTFNGSPFPSDRQIAQRPDQTPGRPPA